MSDMHKRKKAPETVRQNLIDASLQLMASAGLEKMSLKEVADNAGVSKGGLIHHFPSKKELIIASLKHALSSIDQHLHRYMENDSGGFGIFTRAYIKVSLEPESKYLWDAFSVSLLADKELYLIWDEWLDGHLHKYAETDQSQHLEMIRFAADGVWLKNFVHGTAVEPALLEHLLQKTRDIKA